MNKILFVTGSLARGGAQRVITLLAKEFVRLGWEVHMVVMLKSDTGYHLDEHIIVHDLTKDGNYLINSFFWIRHLRQLLKRIKPSVVISFVGRINVITLISAHALNIPVLVSERNDPACDRRNIIEKKICALMYKSADCVVFQTRYQQNYFKKACKNNSVVIGNPIEAPLYEGEHKNQDVISVGKLMAQKNHPVLIEAFAKIADKYPNINVHIFGDGKERSTLQNLINSYHLENRIILEGNIENIFDMMHKYKYFVMTSDYEGLSNALLEAMSSGMVCITTDWNGVEEVVIDNYNGYVVDKRDVDELAKRMDMIFSGEEKTEQCQKNAITTAKEYSMNVVMRKWIKVIKNISMN